MATGTMPTAPTLARDGRDPQAVASWLRRRGKAKRADISRDERADLAACFAMLDEDGSGAIDARELVEAFQLLGLPATLEQCRRMVSEVDRDASGQVEFPEFVQLMTTDLGIVHDEDESAATVAHQRRMQRLRREATRGGGVGVLSNRAEGHRHRSFTREELERAAAEATATTATTAPDASERPAARVDDAVPLPFALLAVAHRRRRFMEQVCTNADGARVRILEKAEEAAREDEAARRRAEEELRRAVRRNRAAPKYMEYGRRAAAGTFEENAMDRRMRRELRRRSMAYSDGIARQLLDARYFPTKGGRNASQGGETRADESVAGSDDDRDEADGDVVPVPARFRFASNGNRVVVDPESGVLTASVVPSVGARPSSPETRARRSEARLARARRALAQRLGTDLPELDPAGRRRAREGARRVARREEEEAAEAMRASGVIDAARAADAAVAAGGDVDEDDASEGIAATSRPYLLEDTDDDGSGSGSDSDSERGDRTNGGSRDAATGRGRETMKGRFEVRPALVEALGSLTAEEASAMRDALGSARKTTRATTRLGIEPGTATRLATSREPLALTRDEMRRVRVTERCLWEQRRDEDGSPSRSPSTKAKSLASLSRTTVASEATTASPARRPGAAARAAALEAAKARGMFGESPEKPPPRFRTVFVGKSAGTSARDVSEDVVRGAAVSMSGSRTTRTGGDSDRPAARRLETLARPSVVSASIGRAALRGVREEEVRMVGAGMERGRDAAAAGGAAATGPLDLLNDAAAPGTAGQRGEGAMLVELGLPDVAFATVPMPARAEDVVRGLD